MECPKCKALEAERYECIQHYAKVMEATQVGRRISSGIRSTCTGVQPREPALVDSAEMGLSAAWNRLEEHRKTHPNGWRWALHTLMSETS